MTGEKEHRRHCALLLDQGSFGDPGQTMWSEWLNIRGTLHARIFVRHPAAASILRQHLEKSPCTLRGFCFARQDFAWGHGLAVV